ncbi:MAG: hypothetical protein GPJ03_21945 [Microcystis aeruginosa G13-01]|nr:hypothetical protein [Microcystis aeruginosa LL11-07]NCS22100.1 hypothetical protein [Microcystis aeruginosa G11-06]NCT65442.1 hypothetical protein [Microcystis aeruginosa G13-01]
MQHPSLTRFEPATTLDEIYSTTSPEPLLTQKEIDAFYREEMNRVRGEDKIERLKLGLKRAIDTQQYYKACLMGHTGVGKSTELTRLINDHEIKQHFEPLRFSVLSELDAINFSPLDVFLFMVVEIVEKTAQISRQPSSKNLQKLWDWFSSEEFTRKETRESQIKMEAGAGAKEDSLWNKILGLFAYLKGEFRVASLREKKVVEYRLSRSRDLINIANQLLKECNQNLQETMQRSWLIIGEDFDKISVSREAVRDLFLNYSNIFKDLDIHIIFNVPIALYNSSPGINLTFDHNLLIPDTAVFGQKDHTPNQKGREAVRKVLEARVKSNLFEDGQIERVIIASGGNIRDLLYLLREASEEAIVNQQNLIMSSHITRAINKLRTEYRSRLGKNPHDNDNVSYGDKVLLLKRIYAANPEAQIPNEVLYALLNNRAIQEVDEYEGERCFMVHPLVVDILNAQGHIPTAPDGGVPGGTSS